MTLEHFINYYLRLYWQWFVMIGLLGIDTGLLIVLAIIFRKRN